MDDTSAIQIGLQGFTVAVVVLFLVDCLWWILAGSKDDGVRGRVAWPLAVLSRLGWFAISATLLGAFGYGVYLAMSAVLRWIGYV